ncbi:hypothetical protein Fmac_019233 [Flemingia macrophylla]|uniref:RING-type E3 ubiquitin transferase n=1 Tax=Flemingia macrophylla TaxID=520843 RepID=A0ABD1M7N3_9FABA
MSGYLDEDHDHFPDHSDFNRRILIVAIVSLTVVLVLVFALHLYARFILRRQSRRRNAIHLLTLNVAQAHNHHNHTDQPPNMGGGGGGGLDPTLITTLPTFPIKSQQHDSVECSVCLSVLEDGESVRMLPNCKHCTFHVSCIDTWLSSHSTCPLCRTNAQPLLHLQPQPREGPSSLLLFEGTSDGSPKTSSRLSSFRRILSIRERSSTRILPSSTHDHVAHHEHDLERHYLEGNFGGNQLLDGSISLSPLYPSQTNDLHVSIAAGLHQSFLWLRPAQVSQIFYYHPRVLRNFCENLEDHASPYTERRQFLRRLVGEIGIFLWVPLEVLDTPPHSLRRHLLVDA